MSASRIVEVAELDLRFEARSWPFAEAEAAKIAAHWRARRTAQPRLYNGRALLLGRHALERRADGREVLRGDFFEADYAAFLAWKDFGFPDAEVCNAFSMAALVAADGAFLLGEMAAHTANAGAIYFPAGTPDPKDVFAGRVDLTASATRELEEETGVAADEVAFGPAWTVVYDPPRIACMKVMRLAAPAAAIKARVDAFLAADPEAELATMHIARGPEDIDAERSPRFVVDFLRYAFARRTSDAFLA
ncbi:MAG: NUDIX domain-containing protein [Roseiarcus sp.]